MKQTLSLIALIAACAGFWFLVYLVADYYLRTI